MTNIKHTLFVTKKAKELSKELHIAEHRLVTGKAPDENHKLYDWYYIMASSIYQNLSDRIDLLASAMIETNKELKKLVDEMKDISKQQKYLWQTLTEQMEKNK